MNYRNFVHFPIDDQSSDLDEASLIGTEEAAALLNLSPNGLIKRTRTKHNRPIPIRVGRLWRYDKAEVIAVKRMLEWLCCE